MNDRDIIQGKLEQCPTCHRNNPLPPYILLHSKGADPERLSLDNSTHFELNRKNESVWCTHGDWQGWLTFDDTGRLTTLRIPIPGCGITEQPIHGYTLTHHKMEYYRDRRPDAFYRTVLTHRDITVYGTGGEFQRIVDKYRDRFVHESEGSYRVFGSVCVPKWDLTDFFYQVSPREKGEMFSAKDSVEVTSVQNRIVYVEGPSKATLNAPLMVRMALKYEGKSILHLHEFLPNAPTVPFAQPGSVADNEREIPGPVFNIEGHGFIACLDDNLEIVKS